MKNSNQKTAPKMEKSDGQQPFDQVKDVNKSAYLKYGIKKGPLTVFSKQSFFDKIFYRFSKKIIALGVSKAYTKDDLWNLPPTWKAETAYPKFKAYFDKKYNDPKNTDRFGLILFKYVSFDPRLRVEAKIFFGR
jgi:hypothetical protein